MINLETLSDLKRNKQINRLVNLLVSFSNNSIYFSLEDKTISNNHKTNSIKIVAKNAFEKADNILRIMEQNNIIFKEKELKIDLT